MRGNKFLLLLLFILVVLSGCGGSSGGKKNGGVAVTIQPTEITLDQGEPHQFTATVSGATNKGVTWSVSPEGGGTITTDGSYTAPDADGTYYVIAASVANPTKKAQAKVTVRWVEVTIEPNAVDLECGEECQFTATVTGTTNKGITWSVDGDGTITDDGLYTAPESTGNFGVIATSQADPTKDARANVTVMGSE